MELVRDVAMRSGTAIVNQHARTHSAVLIPPLQAGLFDPSWRIRQSSVELLGSLMYRIAGVKAIVPDEIDIEADTEVENFAPSSASKLRNTFYSCLSSCCAQLSAIRCAAVAAAV